MSNTEDVDAFKDQHNLSEDDLNQEISDSHLDQIALKHCACWKLLSPHLDLGNMTINDITLSLTLATETDKSVEFFRQWKKVKGFEATYKKLVAALLKIDQKHEAGIVCKLLKQSYQSVQAQEQHQSTEAQEPDPGENEMKGDLINIPAIYQPVVVQHGGEVIHDDDECSPEEDPEDYDLTAPPLESWYHGRINRQMACERLELVGEPGGYLVRESVAQPGDYAISFLSRMGHVHHFKINSNCGDYYIGGRQFYSLNDLIGFYASCSCIIENESLEVPVVPPKPVPLYMMLRATTPHQKTPGTDELTIERGEVFLLLSLLSDEWGWGRSQKSELSGLIPIAIMEDVTHEDSNLGKPWFHGAVGREEAVDLLMKVKTPGTFLVRKGSSRGGEDEHIIRYSMAVRTPERVQRFLITRHVTGYYLFGGRPFNSIEDIIELYRSEVILDGLKLTYPLPKEPEMMEASQAPAKRVEPGTANRRPSEIPARQDMPGDITGTLSLKKGKKSPVYGKWKEYYFVVKCNEKRLLYYEQESRHRAKGLLDLRQCKVYEVHPSLFGPHCIVLVLKYLNETTFYYLSAGTTGNSQEWWRALRHCMHPVEDQKEIQQTRSLNLVIKDCKLAKSSSQVFGLVFIDEACVARTRVISESVCIFDEEFYFDDLPLYAADFSCEVHSTPKRLRSIVGKENCLGRLHVHLSDLPSGQEDDRWHQLLLGHSKVMKGTVRLNALFKDYVILPVKEYSHLKELILSDDLKVIEVLAKVCKDHHAELASTLLHIFSTYDRLLPLINAYLAKSVDNEENVSTLFRASTLSTMLMDQYMKLTALDYLRSILRAPVKQIIECPDSCEVSPFNLPKGADLSSHRDRLQAHITRVLLVIFSSVEQCPPTLRYIYHCLQEKVSQKWPGDETVRIRAISGFLFLRFICPALLKPQLFDIVSELPSPMADRTLKLVTKTIQNLANLVEFKRKEALMVYLNPFINEYMQRMKLFVNDVSKWDQPPQYSGLDTVNPAKDLSTISHLCHIYNDNLNKLAKTMPEVKDLLDVMAALKRAEKKYTTKNRYS